MDKTITAQALYDLAVVAYWPAVADLPDLFIWLGLTGAPSGYAEIETDILSYHDDGAVALDWLDALVDDGIVRGISDVTHLPLDLLAPYMGRRLLDVIGDIRQAYDDYYRPVISDWTPDGIIID